MIARILILLLIVLTNLKLEAKSFKRIPRPIIQTDNIFVSPGAEFIIQGQGFIENYPKAHKARLKKGKKSYKVKVISSSANSLSLKAPKNLGYGDYDIRVRIKTRLLRSKASKRQGTIKLRPKAPPAPSFSHQVIKDTSELENNISEQQFLGHKLDIKLNETDLRLGPNKISSTYTINGWTSLESATSLLYYFPESEMRSSLSLESEAPLKALALTKDRESSFDVSSITHNELEDLSKHFFLSTPSFPKYLEHIVNLSPIYIEKLHVKADEYAVLKNRSSEDFLLENCSLSDSIRQRYEFEAHEKIPAKQSIKVEANLGLNDSSPDSLSIACNDEEIDIFNYKGLDAAGYGIRD